MEDEAKIPRCGESIRLLGAKAALLSGSWADPRPSRRPPAAGPTVERLSAEIFPWLRTMRRVDAAVASRCPLWLARVNPVGGKPPVADDDPARIFA